MQCFTPMTLKYGTGSRMTGDMYVPSQTRVFCFGTSAMIFFVCVHTRTRIHAHSAPMMCARGYSWRCVPCVVVVVLGALWCGLFELVNTFILSLRCFDFLCSFHLNRASGSILQLRHGASRGRLCAAPCDSHFVSLGAGLVLLGLSELLRDLHFSSYNFHG